MSESCDRCGHYSEDLEANLAGEQLCKRCRDTIRGRSSTRRADQQSIESFATDDARTDGGTVAEAGRTLKVPDRRERSDDATRHFVCVGCRKQQPGIPEFIDEETWDGYCSLECVEYEPIHGCPHVDDGELSCPSCFFDGNGGDAR